MSTKGRASAEPGRLYVGPSGLSLPSLLPDAVAAEAALRFTHMSYTAVPSLTSAVEGLDAGATARCLAEVHRVDSTTTFLGATSVAPLYVMPGSGACRAGLEAIVESLGQSTASHHVRLNAGLSGTERSTVDGLVALVRTTVFPALEFAMYGNDATFDLLRKSGSMQPDTTFLDRLRQPLQSFRLGRLRQLREQFGLRTEGDAIALAERGLQALERYLVASGVTISVATAGGAASGEPGNATADRSPERSSATDCRFFVSPATPTTVDCVVYAAVAMACGMRVAPTSAWAKFQLDAGLSLDCIAASGGVGGAQPQTYPLLCYFGRSVAHRYFEQYAGLHYIQLPPARFMNKDEIDVYAKGRAPVIVGTVVAVLSYAMIVNIAPILLAIAEHLELDLSVEGGQGEGEGEEHEEAAGGGGRHHQQQKD